MLTDEVLTELERLGTKSVVLLGLEAHVCVQQTCLDLLDRGLDVFVVADGTSRYQTTIINLFLPLRGL
jgi:nicotinamidase-related amidase